MKHPTKLKSGQSLEELAEELGNLRYDALVKFFGYLIKKLRKDYNKDGEKGRFQLRRALQDAKLGLDRTEHYLNKAWDICKPYMKEEDKDV